MSVCSRVDISVESNFENPYLLLCGKSFTDGYKVYLVEHNLFHTLEIERNNEIRFLVVLVVTAAVEAELVTKTPG